MRRFRAALGKEVLDGGVDLVDALRRVHLTQLALFLVVCQNRHARRGVRMEALANGLGVVIKSSRTILCAVNKTRLHHLLRAVQIEEESARHNTLLEHVALLDVARKTIDEEELALRIGVDGLLEQLDGDLRGNDFPLSEMRYAKQRSKGKYLLHESFNHLASLGATFRLCAKQIAWRC